MKAENKKVAKIAALVIGVAIILYLLLRKNGQLIQNIQEAASPLMSVGLPEIAPVDIDVPGFDFTPHDYPMPSIPAPSFKPCNFCITSRVELAPASPPAPAPPPIIREVQIPQIPSRTHWGMGSVPAPPGPKGRYYGVSGWSI